MTQVKLSWAPRDDALVSTDYRIESDEATPNVFLPLAGMPLNAVANPAGGYGPIKTTLVGAILAGSASLTLGDATHIADNKVIIIDKEAFLTGGKSGNTFSACKGGQQGTIRRDHANEAVVYLAHESHTDNPDFDDRHVIRYRVVAIDGSEEHIAAETNAIKPSKPRNNDLCTVWGIEETVQGAPRAGVQLRISINDGDNFNAGDSASYYRSVEETTSDESGYWEFQLPRDLSHQGGDTFTLTRAANDDFAREDHVLRTIPDRDQVCFIECL